MPTVDFLIMMEDDPPEHPAELRRLRAQRGTVVDYVPAGNDVGNAIRTEDEWRVIRVVDISMDDIQIAIARGVRSVGDIAIDRAAAHRVNKFPVDNYSWGAKKVPDMEMSAPDFMAALVPYE